MEEKYWSRFADDFEERNNYVAGKNNILAIQQAIHDRALSGTGLELGCGNGTYSRILAKTASRLYATDLSDQMLAESGQRLKQYDNIIIEKQNCLALSYPDAGYDFVVMVNLLHVIDNPKKAVLESKRVLKKNGRLLVISFTMEGMPFMARMNMIYRYLRTYGKPPEQSRRLTLDMTDSILKEADFKVDESMLVGENVKAIFALAVLK